MIWLLWFSAAIGLAATVTDLRSRTIPNTLSAAAFAGGVAARSALYGWTGAKEALIGGAIGFAVFLVFFVLGGMGGGDVKLMAGFGAIVGYPQIITAAVMTAIVGAVMALIYLVQKKVRRLWSRKRRTESESEPADGKDFIPYAPAIAAGVLLSFLSEEELWTSVC